MAKSKSGGTRSYIRGRVGADVYSIGRDAKGAKQQVVRSLAETVANPQTIAQMRGRMIMSTVMQAVSAMRPIIDHSFDDVPAGQPSISEFISRNYALIKADIDAHPSSGNDFGLNSYQERGIKIGKYVISKGAHTLPSVVTVNQLGITIGMSVENGTVGDYKAAMALGSEDYVTLIALKQLDGQLPEFLFCRLKVKDGVTDATALTTANIDTIFDMEGNWTPSLTAAAGGDGWVLKYQDQEAVKACNGVIVSYKTASGYKHTTCVLAGSGSNENTADVALPTYPVGTEMFLNGGDI